jgi:hypothetical protein
LGLHAHILGPSFSRALADVFLGFSSLREEPSIEGVALSKAIESQTGIDRSSVDDLPSLISKK